MFILITSHIQSQYPSQKEMLGGETEEGGIEDEPPMPDTEIAGLNLDEALDAAGLTSSCIGKRRAATDMEKYTALLKKPRKISNK